ncbi:MAG TPA: transketolase C-terminal domain-containing protein [Bryobacteraceae bacterium]|nr:transketolase C-terminal domain-containing protein [Bryobacteraceae bacterium]HOL70462.1 transketolase C-terminal domain-containing protein [Bryobacteraceae bacterium]HOQ46991.1 transketolase C-terminal domain-containing protein [Bryobacteraceae bacterium]HPQ15892.1 transketolase C-terminal domain-containing protein [Bryobacteraceae bacterium]HPU73082.1 transketolase C-terminal domain-containing protein [Bryobacteraceae bacterium]
MTVTQAAMRDALGDALLELAPRFPDMVVLDADVSSSTRTAAFGKAYPERFFNVGVAEANMVDIAAGMATCGLRPVASTFAIFLTLKAGDPIRNTICYGKLPVIFAAGYGGLSDSYDGASHQSIADLAVVRAMPNMTVVVPADVIEVRQALEAALLMEGPVYIRLSRNPTPVLFEGSPPLEIGKIRKLRDGSDLTIAVCGVPTFMAIEAADRLAASGISVDLLEVSTLKPIDAEALARSAAKTRRVLTVEEHSIHGGLAGAVAETLGRLAPARMDFIGIEDTFPESGDYMELLKKYGISAEHIENRAKALVKEG